MILLNLVLRCGYRKMGVPPECSKSQGDVVYKSYPECFTEDWREESQMEFSSGKFPYVTIVTNGIGGKVNCE